MPGGTRMTRRSALGALGGMAAAASLSVAEDEHQGRLSGLGIVLYCAGIQREALRAENPAFDLFDPASFLEYCVGVGAGGMQARLGVMEPAEAARLRKAAEETERYIEAIVSVPMEREDVPQFEAEIRTAVEAGALAARTTIIPGRRYEQFDSLESFKEADRRGRRAAELAAPICERHRMPLAIENHKDHRNDERLALFEHLSSEYVGACLDTGNSIALLEDPMETVEVFTPWAHSVHLKDQSLTEYEEGFLLGDVPLGEGSLDLAQMVETIRAARPAVRFTLELITRDPLEVPCLNTKYWTTFPDLPGRDVASTLQYVREHTTDTHQHASKLPAAEQRALEEANIRQSLRYAGETLKI